MWTLEEGVHFVRELEKALRPLGYWTALGGGTLYKGVSLHDLDVVIIPLSNNHKAGPGHQGDLMTYLKDRFTLKVAGKPYENAYHIILQTAVGDRKVDLFLPNDLRYAVMTALDIEPPTPSFMKEWDIVMGLDGAPCENCADMLVKGDPFTLIAGGPTCAKCSVEMGVDPHVKQGAK